MSVVGGSVMCSAPSSCTDELQAIDNVVSGTEARITPSFALLKLPSALLKWLYSEQEWKFTACFCPRPIVHVTAGAGHTCNACTLPGWPCKLRTAWQYGFRGRSVQPGQRLQRCYPWRWRQC